MTDHIPWYMVNEKDGTELVLVPGGWFWMGVVEKDTQAGSSEKPGHLHYLSSFYMGIACVTVKQFAHFVKETGHDAAKDWKKDSDDHPVRSVNWHDATAYCKWVGLRLPTEPEWEYCARGYHGLIYPWGDDWEDGRRVCWDLQKGPNRNTAPVYDHPRGAGPAGTFQQSGNLWEWCDDWFDGDVYKRYAEGDFKPPDSGTRRVLRGGSWDLNLPSYFRGGYRPYDLPDSRLSRYGFRSARTITI
jgi:formylglycine-generating enzyme required for sulfatase activity